MLAGYAAPALPLAILTLPVYIFLPAFYTQGIGVPIATVGAILLLTRIADAISDPLIGYACDRISTGYGRRKFWLILGAPVAMLSAYMLFVPPEGAGATHLLIWSLALSLAWTVMLIPYAAWGAELTGDYDERNRVAGVRESFTVIGTLLASATPALLPAFGYADKADSMFAMALLVVILLPVAVTVACWSAPEPAELSTRRTSLREGFKLLTGNRAFLRLLSAYLANGIANALPATLFLFFVSYRLGSPESYGPMLFVYFLCGVIGIPGWLALAHRTSKKGAWTVAMLIACAVFLTVPLLGTGDIAAFWVIVVISGLCLGADLSLPPSMQADVVDLDTLESGEQRTATYFALWGLATKGALALAVGIAFPILGAAGFEPDAGKTETGLVALALLYSAVPVAFKLTAIAIMHGYPVTRELQLEVRRKLEHRDQR